MINIVERSQLINDEESKKFDSIVELKSKIYYFTVARLYQAVNNGWQHLHTGLLTITKDSNRKKYYLEMYDMDNLRKCWDHAIGLNFIYNVFKNQIHTFTANDIPSLLSFANYEESQKFFEEFKKVENDRKQQKNKKKRISELNAGNQYPTIAENTVGIRQSAKPQTTMQGKKAKFSKSDISNPTNFKHIDHMGINDHFFENPEDENLKAYLKKFDMENLLDNDKSKRDIYEFIEKSGGLKKLESEMKQQMRTAPPAPTKNPPPPPSRINAGMPNPQIQKPPPSGSLVPPPPFGSLAPPPPSGSLAPPPPPPPPAPAPPPMPILTKPTSHSNVLPPTSGKGGLLAEIEKFDATRLKARTDVDEITVPAPVVGGSLLDSLAQYLVQRKTLLTGNSDSDASEDNDEEDDEWE